ncbi:MAG: pyridoxal phosphate-dependent aminotransferase [Ignavibacteria bacterium]|nr:pyridoxal phosphate-dependent aminotransferase [Ignavibacteria bacterium]
MKDELQKQQFEILDLSESNPTKCGFDYSALDIDNIFRSGNNLLYQPEPKGLFAVREKIAEYYNRRKNRFPSQEINPENIFLTSGTSESYSHIFKILCNPGDEILIPKPGYPLFEMLAGINYLKYKYYGLKYDGNWRIDFDSLENVITDKVKAIIIVNPNNPTGNYLTLQELQKLSLICSQKGIPVICDEVFYDYNLITLNGKADFVNTEFDFPVFILNGLSKISATPQFKLGWILVNSPDKYLKKINDSLEIVCDTYLSVNSIIQNSFEKVMNFRNEIQSQIKLRTVNNYNYLYTKYPQVYNIEGGWNAIPELTSQVDEEYFTENLLRTHKIFVHPGYFYNFDNSPRIVLSLLLPADIFNEAIINMISILRGYEKRQIH